jgi:hypothetical protein
MVKKEVQDRLVLQDLLAFLVLEGNLVSMEVQVHLESRE